MTLERILEPEVMDSEDEARDYDAMDHSAVNQVFVEDFLSVGSTCRDILDVGTGTAQLPIALCQVSQSCRVMAIDLSESMLDWAICNIDRASLRERIQLDKIDAKQMPYDDGRFDAVISNSIVHHIADPLPCLAEMSRVTRPGGVLFVRDLMRPANRETLDRLVETYAGEESNHAQQMFAESLHAALTLDEIREMATELGFSVDCVTATTDRHWTFSAIATEK